MSSRKEQGTRVRKKPYTKPEVKKVHLRPEEAVLGFCKTTGKTGPAGNQADCGYPATPCPSQGS